MRSSLFHLALSPGSESGAPTKTTASGFGSATTESASTQPIISGYLAFSSACTVQRFILGSASVWLSWPEEYLEWEAPSGLSPASDKGAGFGLSSRRLARAPSRGPGAVLTACHYSNV